MSTRLVGTWAAPWNVTYQRTLSIPCNNLSIVGKGQGETTVHGGLVAEDGRSLSVTSLALKNSSGGRVTGLIISGMGTKLDLQKVTVENCKGGGVDARDGAKVVATGCQFSQNGTTGVYVAGSTTTARLTNCISHHNKVAGVLAAYGAVVDLMGEGTSVHDNERYGLYAFDRGTTINVYQPCILNDMSHGNKRQNIFEQSGGIVRQKEKYNKKK